MSGTLQALTPREASIFACFADTVVAPTPKLPPVRETDTAFAFDRWMAQSPKLNRLGMRALLYVIELAPIAAGFGRRLRRLDRADRERWLRGVEKLPQPQAKLLWKLVKGAAQLSYYGDDRVLLQVGYDAEANLTRGRELRRAEGRP